MLAFCFRLAVGLCSDFHTEVQDEKQIYLIGLKFYTTGNWPYFGPDVTHTIQIPGALQGLIVGLPLYLLPLPEAPFILLNLLSFAALCFLAWYCCRRLPEIPGWVVWSWLLTAPWVLGLSTQVYNPSYVLFGAIMFFVAAIETYPFLTRDLIPVRWANFMMGFGLFWIMQFHLSFVDLLPFVALSLYFQIRHHGVKVWRRLIWFVGGAIIPASVLLPTFLKFGLRGGEGNINEAVQVSQHNLSRNLNVVEGVLGRFLSFASYELPRFIGGNTNARLAFLREHHWLIPFVVFLTVVGIAQSILLLLLWFRQKNQAPDWPAIKYFTLATVLLLYLSFIFSLKSPASHTFYFTLPVAMLYSFYCWKDFLTKKLWRTFALIVIVSGIIFQIGLAAHNFHRTSFYVDRSRVQQAIDQKDYRVLGERREGSRY